MIEKIYKNRKISLLIILIVATFVRILYLGEYQQAFFRDEAALGYNAYSIWETGKDEFGKSFPLFFRSFEVFFMPAYVYLLAPIVGFLGLNVFSTRLLSALSGVLIVLASYLISEKVWNRKTAFFVSLIVALSPWSVYYSRAAFEGNLGLAFFSFALLFWINYLSSDKMHNFFISVFLFALSMYSYQSERVVVPLFAIFAALLSIKQLWNKKTKIFIYLLPVILMLLPQLIFSLKPGSYHRAAGVSIFASTSSKTIFHRSEQVISLYSSYFSPRNLFSEGDANLQRGVEGMSVFYAWMLPFLIIGIYKSLKRNNKLDKLLIFYMLVAPIPAALTADPFHTYRSLMLYLPLSLFIGRGISSSSKLITNISIYAIIFSFSFFVYSYITLTPVIRGEYWDYGYKDLVSKVNRLPEDSRVVVYDDITEAYIHYLFFTPIPPDEYQQYVSDYRQGLGYYYNDPSEIRPVKVRNVEFREVDWPTERGDKGTYFVFAARHLPESEFVNDPNVELVDELLYLNGDTSFRIVKINE